MRYRMKVLKFTVNETYYNQFKEICDAENLNIKRMLNILVSRDTSPGELKSYFPEDYLETPKKLTLKVNEELYKGVMKKCGQYDFRVRVYLPYLIYKFLGENNS